jgi:hypothetical protein
MAWRLVVLAALVAVVVASATAAAAAQQTPPDLSLPREEVREQNLHAYIELLRRDLRKDKAALVADLMDLTAVEETGFWPVYREYERRLTHLNDERIAALETYAREQGRFTTDIADALALRTLDLEARRTALMRDYYVKLKSTVLSPIEAARALQIEHQIQLLLDLQVAASLPMVR